MKGFAVAAHNSSHIQQEQHAHLICLHLQLMAHCRRLTTPKMHLVMLP